MYVNPLHELTDREALFSLMASHPLGAWVCHGREGLIANHVPFLLDRSRGPLGTLIGHVSRANTVWRELGPATSSVVMFQGPQAYITPGWYPSKAEHGRVVPTWNYVVAHAHGVARAIEDRDWMLDMLSRLTDIHEARRSVPWSVGDAPSLVHRQADARHRRHRDTDRSAGRQAQGQPGRSDAGQARHGSRAAQGDLRRGRGDGRSRHEGDRGGRIRAVLTRASGSLVQRERQLSYRG